MVPAAAAAQSPRPHSGLRGAGDGPDTIVQLIFGSDTRDAVIKDALGLITGQTPPP